MTIDDANEEASFFLGSKPNKRRNIVLGLRSPTRILVLLTHERTG